MVSEVSFPRFWGVLCIAKCFRFFVSVIGSAVFEISRLARFYVKSRESRYLDFLVTGEVMRILEQPSDLPVLFIFVGVASSA